MSDPLHVAERLGMALLARAEQSVLLHQRSDVPGRIAHRDHEPGIGKELEQILEPADDVVVLGQVAPAAADPHELADVIAIERFELGVPGVARQHRALRRVVQAWEERHPDDLFEGLGAFGRDRDAVAMRPLRGRGGALRYVLQKAVPPIGREHRRIVAIAMRGEIRVLGERLEEDRAAGAGDAADVDRLGPARCRRGRLR